MREILDRLERRLSRHRPDFAALSAALGPATETEARALVTT